MAGAHPTAAAAFFVQTSINLGALPRAVFVSSAYSVFSSRTPAPAIRPSMTTRHWVEVSSTEIFSICPSSNVEMLAFNGDTREPEADQARSGTLPARNRAEVSSMIKLPCACSPESDALAMSCFSK